MLDVLPQGLVQALGWTLLEFVPQGAVIAALYAAMRFGWSDAAPRARLFAGHLALLALGLAPAVTFIGHLSSGPAAPALVGGTAALQAVERVSGASMASAGWMPPLVLAWGLGVAVLSLRAALQWWGLQWVRRQARPLQEEWRERLDRLRRRMGIRSSVALLESAHVEVPLVVGWIKPAILLPLGLGLRMPASQLELVIAHELAHLRRFDHLANLLQVVLETLLFYHPAVHWISRCVRADREQCCDDLVTRTGGDRRTYARALLALEELRARVPTRLVLAANGGVLLERIERIVMREPRAGRPPVSLWLALAGTVAALLLQSLPNAALRDEIARRALEVALAPVTWRAPSPALRVEDLAPALDRGPVAWRFEAVEPAIAIESPQPRAAAAIDVRTPDAAVARDARIPSQAPAVAAVPPAAGNAAASPASVSPPSTAAAMSSRAPDAAPAGPAAPVRIAGAAPEYPAQARLAGIEGQVVVSYVIGADGNVADVIVESSRPRGMFTAPVRRALAQWRFEPTGEAVPMRQTFEFRLGGSPGEGEPSDCMVQSGTRLCRPIP